MTPAPYWYLGSSIDYTPRSNTKHWPAGTPGSKGGEFAPGPGGHPHTPHTGSVPGDIPTASRPHIEAGASDVLDPHSIRLDFLEVAPTSKRLHRAEGGRFPDGRLGIRISPTVGTSPAKAQRDADDQRALFEARRAEEIAKLEARLARDPRMARNVGPRLDELRATRRRNTYHDAPDPLHAIAAHEAAHVIEAHYGKDKHRAVWERHTAGIPRLDRLRVSEYAATASTELWAEVAAAIAAGIDIPVSLREAYDRTTTELDKQHA